LCEGLGEKTGYQGGRKHLVCPGGWKNRGGGRPKNVGKPKKRKPNLPRELGTDKGGVSGGEKRGVVTGKPGKRGEKNNDLGP